MEMKLDYLVEGFKKQFRFTLQFTFSNNDPFMI